MNSDSVSMEVVSRFARKLSHEWRNALNCLDLHLAAVCHGGDLAEREAEAQAAHALIQATARKLSLVTRRISAVDARLIPYPVNFLIEDIRKRWDSTLAEGAERFQWTVQSDAQSILIDFEVLCSGLLELFQNVLVFNAPGTVFAVNVAVQDHWLCLDLMEPRSTDPHPETWGRPPLVSTQHGHYGLGLYHCRQVLAAHGGKLEFHFDPVEKILHTEVRLPIFTP